MLTSCPDLRKQLKKATWGSEGKNIPVKGKTRDLGAFFNSTCQRLAGTTITRIRNGSVDAVRIASLPRNTTARERMLATKALPRAFYGTEATQPRIQDIRRMAGVCATALVGKHQTQRAPEVATAMGGAGRTEVATHIMLRRWALMRRMWHLRASWRQQIQDIAARYLQQEGQGNQHPQDTGGQHAHKQKQ